MKRTKTASSLHNPAESSLLITPNQKLQKHLSRRRLKVEEDAQRFAGRFASVVIAEKSEITPTTPQTPEPFSINNAIFSPQKTPSKISFLSPTVAVKTQRILEPKNINETSYRELKILKALSKLKKTKVCGNFVEMYDFVKTNGDEEQDEDPRYQYMNYMLERGDMSLHSFIRKTILPLATFKSILFQLLFGLYIGQRELEFQHNDLHSKNVLVKFLKDSHDGCAFYARFDDSEVRWLTKENFVIKLTDFGHSRIKLASGEVICNNKDPFSTIFDPKSDLKKIEHELRTVKIDWTNSNEQPVLKDLKSKMRDPYSYPPGELLLHPFFDSLKREGDLTLQERKRLLHFDRRGDFSDEIEALAQHVADVHVDKENTAPEQTQTTAVRSRRKRKRLSNITNETPVAKVVEKRKIEEESEPVRVVRRRTRIYNK